MQAALGREPAVAAVRERLRLGGLAPTPEQRARYRAAGLWFAPLVVLGVARAAAGSANGRPVGFLVALLAVTVAVAVVAALRVPDATELGRRTLGRLRAETRRPPVGASPAELGMATALFGAGVLGRPTSRRPWPCGSPASTAPTSAASAARAAAAAAVAVAGAAVAAAAGAADDPGPDPLPLGRGRHRVAGGAGRVRGTARRAGVRRGGGREHPRRPAAADRAGGAGAAGVPVVPHRVRLSLGSAGAAPDPARVGHLAGLAERLGAPLVSEHVAFVRGGGLEAGHLLPVPRTRAALGVLTANVRLAQAGLGVPWPSSMWPPC